MHKIILSVLILFCLTAVVIADDTTSLICPFNEPGEGLSVPGYDLEAGFQITSEAVDGFVLSHQELWQQAGGGKSTTLSEGQGYSVDLNGQGGWNYSGGWKTTGNNVNTEQSLQVYNGRMNPGEILVMDGRVCPPVEGTYSDNQTHTVFQETAFAENRGDISEGSYAAVGVIGPGKLDSAMGIHGNAWAWSAAGYNAMTGISQNVTEDVTYTGYSIVGKTLVPYTYTVTESKTETTKTGWTQYHGYIWRGSSDLTLITNFHFKSTKTGL